MTHIMNHRNNDRKRVILVLDFYLSQAARRLTPEILILNSNFAGQSNPNLLSRPIRNQKEQGIFRRIWLLWVSENSFQSETIAKC